MYGKGVRPGSNIVHFGGLGGWETKKCYWTVVLAIFETSQVRGDVGG